MARHDEEIFRNRRLNVDGEEYIGCDFEDCVMVFRGDIPGP